MARTLSDPKVGDLVYPAYTPIWAGVVTAVDGDVVTFVLPGHPELPRKEHKSTLRDYSALIEESEKKFRAHLAHGCKLNALAIKLAINAIDVGDPE